MIAALEAWKTVLTKRPDANIEGSLTFAELHRLNIWKAFIQNDQHFRDVFFTVKTVIGAIHPWYDLADENVHQQQQMHPHWSSNSHYYAHSAEHHRQANYPSYSPSAKYQQGEASDSVISYSHPDFHQLMGNKVMMPTQVLLSLRMVCQSWRFSDNFDLL